MIVVEIRIFEFWPFSEFLVLFANSRVPSSRCARVTFNYLRIKLKTLKKRWKLENANLDYYHFRVCFTDVPCFAHNFWTGCPIKLNLVSKCAQLNSLSEQIDNLDHRALVRNGRRRDSLFFACQNEALITYSLATRVSNWMKLPPADRSSPNLHEAEFCRNLSSLENIKELL